MSFNLMSVANWVVDTFPILRIVMMVVMVLIGLGIIVCVMCQPSSSSGMGAITGARDTYYSKDKSKSLESVMKKLTVILGIIEGVLAILFFITLFIYRGN